LVQRAQFVRREPLIFRPEDGKRRLRSLGRLFAIMIAHAVKYIGHLRNSRSVASDKGMYERFPRATIPYKVDGL
jgi:hypothetical protein